MKVYFEDGKLRHYSTLPVEIEFTVNAGDGVNACIDRLDLFMRQRPDAIIYTNSIFAFHNMYAWNEELGVPEIYIRAGEQEEWVRVDQLTRRELRRAHNLAHMYVAGEFDKMRSEYHVNKHTTA